MALSAVFIGDESLMVRCAELWLQRGNRIAAVVTADRAILQWAEELQVPVLAPGRELATRLPPDFDVLLSVANLRMLSGEVLARPSLAAINFHDGPLPAYAGLNAPVWALLRGEAEHGITWHLMTESADEGRIVVERRFPIEPEDTALALNARCYEAGAEAFEEVADQLERGEVSGRPQPDGPRGYFSRRDRPASLAAISFASKAEPVLNLVRALNFGKYENPLTWPKLVGPGAIVCVEKASLAEPASSEQPASAPGCLLSVEGNGLVVATEDTAVVLSGFRAPDGSPLSVAQVLSELGAEVGGNLQPSEEKLATLNALAEGTHHDVFWAARLKQATPCPAPLARPQGEPSGELSHPLGANNAEEALAAVAVWACRLTGRTDFWFEHTGPAPSSELAKSVLCTRTPGRLQLSPESSFEQLRQAARQELKRLAERPSFSTDLWGRTPEAAPNRWDIQVAQAGGLFQEPAALQLDLSAQGATLRLRRSHYSEAASEAVMEQLRTLLAAGVARPDTPALSLPLLSEAAHDELVRAANDTQAAPEETQARNAIGDFERVAREQPDRCALVFGRSELTYAQLNARANQLARRLAATGGGGQALVGLLLPRTEDLVVGVLGILKAGCAYLPLDPTYPQERLSYMLEDSGARLVVTNSLLEGQLPEGQASLSLDTDDSLRSQPEQDLGQSPEAAHLAYVIYTSGSTGRPKGVMVEHGNVANFFLAMDQRVPRYEQNTWLAVTSLSFDISVLELLWTLGRGFKVVLATDDRSQLSQGVPQGGMKLDFSLFYFSSDEGGVGAEKYRLLLDGARFADTHGFSAVWTPERHFGAFGGLYPNPSVTSAAIAAVTSNVQIRAGSCVLPLHEPVRVAEEWSVVDNLSGGRVGVSVAAGWHPNDFVLHPENFTDRKAVMLSQVEQLRKLWRGESVELPGPVGPVAVQTWPRPVQTELPLWLTAAGNVETFVAAAQAQAGILTHLLGQTMEELRGKIAAYRREWQRLGNPGEGHIVLMLHTFVGESDAHAKEVVRAPMKQYLMSSITLIAQHAWSFPAFKRSADPTASFNDNFSSLSDSDMDTLLDFSFERYYETAGLFGSTERCLKTLREVTASDVDEVACLIDFGVDVGQVLEQLPRLEKVKSCALQAPVVEDADVSLTAQLVRHQVTHLQCTPSMARMLLLDEGTRAGLMNLKAWMLGGEALPAELVAEIRAVTSSHLLNMYGPTETTVWSCTDRVDAADVSIGTPIANTEVYVLDSQRRLLPRGAEGELYIGGLGVTRGYLGRPELTEERFVPDPFGPRQDGRLYRTGDLVRYREDGKLEFLGRADDQVKIRGHRIELGEIESALCELPAVQQAVVVARRDAPGDARLVAYYRLSGEQTLGETAVRAHLAARLPDYMVPSHLVALRKFPLTPNAKVDRKALPPPAAVATEQGAPYVAPESDIESSIAKVFCIVLGSERVGATDNFFELGGHSLLAVQAHRKLTQELSLTLSITDLFRFPTARSLAERLLGPGSSGDTGALLRAETRRQALDRRTALRRARRGQS